MKRRAKPWRGAQYYASRDAGVLLLRATGATYREIATTARITPQRARQICVVHMIRRGRSRGPALRYCAAVLEVFASKAP